MKNPFLKLTLMSFAVFTIVSCGDSNSNVDDDTTPTTTTEYSGVISENTTWTKENIYTLAGRVVVPSGVTLTIEPGTVVKAYPGQEANACALIVAKGGKLMAQGTSTEPIIFTTTADQISRDHSNYPGFANLDETYKGYWGGVIILGNAEISADAPQKQIEGIPASDSNGLYGGSDNADNSGVIQFVQIRHGGTLLGDDNEINGLTLGGVGTGTVIENVEVIGNVDDGIECFGGSVNISNALVWAQGDDAFDIDQSYSGTIDNFMGIADAESDHALEIDGPEGNMVGMFTMINGTLKGFNDPTINGEYADFRKEATGTVSNTYFHNFSCGSDFEIDGETNTNGAAALTFIALEFNTTHLSDTCKNVASEICDDQTGSGVNFNASDVTAASVGADASAFSGWSCYFTEN